MNWWHHVVHRSRMEEQLEKDLRFHVEQHAADLISSDHHPVEARRQARLALGTGATMAMFTVINGVLLKPLSYPELERLVSCRNRPTSLSTAGVKDVLYCRWPPGVPAALSVSLAKLSMLRDVKSLRGCFPAFAFLCPAGAPSGPKIAALLASFVPARQCKPDRSAEGSTTRVTNEV